MRLTVTTYLTLDGVVQSNGKPEPELDDGFEQGGWQVPYFDADQARLAAMWIANADAFLFGRRTYELFAAHWPQVTDPSDPIATRLNRLPKYVASSTLADPAWPNSTVLTGPLAESVATLKAQRGNELQVHGSATLIRSLLALDLVDELRLVTHPVVLGHGKRLFAEGTVPTAFELVDSEVTGRGVTVHTYRPAGAPTYSSVTLDQVGGTVTDSLSRQASR